jgi:hypothetical protein
MQKDFYIVCKDGERTHSLDVSPFTSLDQLTKTLGHVFAFADTKCKLLLSRYSGSVLTRDSVVAHW